MIWARLLSWSKQCRVYTNYEKLQSLPSLIFFEKRITTYAPCTFLKNLVLKLWMINEKHVVRTCMCVLLQMTELETMAFPNTIPMYKYMTDRGARIAHTSYHSGSVFFNRFNRSLFLNFFLFVFHLVLNFYLCSSFSKMIIFNLKCLIHLCS